MSPLDELKRRNVIRVALAYAAISWLLIQIAGTLFPVFGFDDSPTRLLVLVLAIGFLPALIFTWVFDLGPAEGTGAAAPGAAPDSAHSGARLLDRTIMLVLALALAYFAFDKFVLDPQRQAALQAELAAQLSSARQEGRGEALAASYGDRSIAVLAFEDMSQGGDQEYLSDGIAEELLNLLSRISELRVISRSSAFAYKGRQVKLADIARELNVAHILEGSVRQAGNRVRITAQLIDARSDTHLWSETYDRSLDDIFAIQDEIAAAVVEQLKLTLLGGASPIEEGNPEAYALLLQARHLARQGTATGYEHSIALFEQALALQANYAAAWVGLATSYSNQANKSLRDYDQGYTLAREAALQALTINPNYAPALAHLGWIALVYDNNLALAAQHLQRALALEPANLAIIGNAATLLYTLGRVPASITLDEYVVARDPVNPTGHANLAEGYLSVGRLDEAIASYRTALRLSPERIATHYYIGTALLLQGQPQAALETLQQEKFEVLRLLGLAMAEHALGNSAAADTLLAQLIADYEQEAAYNIAYVLAFRGETDRAFEWLDKAAAYADPGLSDILGETLFTPLHTDPRWPVFLESIGKSPAQLDTIPFEVALPAGP